MTHRAYESLNKNNERMKKNLACRIRELGNGRNKLFSRRRKEEK